MNSGNYNIRSTTTTTTAIHNIDDNDNDGELEEGELLTNTQIRQSLKNLQENIDKYYKKNKYWFRRSR